MNLRDYARSIIREHTLATVNLRREIHGLLPEGHAAAVGAGHLAAQHLGQGSGRHPAGGTAAGDPDAADQGGRCLRVVHRGLPARIGREKTPVTARRPGPARCFGIAVMNPR
jgi:hypothetical protein